MSLLEINTVGRLDRPSAYYVGKVCTPNLPVKTGLVGGQALIEDTQNKRRRHNSRDDDREKGEDPMAKLQNATTLYVGNLYAPTAALARETVALKHDAGRSTLQRNKFTNFFQSTCVCFIS